MAIGPLSSAAAPLLFVLSEDNSLISGFVYSFLFMIKLHLNEI